MRGGRGGGGGGGGGGGRNSNVATTFLALRQVYLPPLPPLPPPTRAWAWTEYQEKLKAIPYSSPLSFSLFLSKTRNDAARRRNHHDVPRFLIINGNHRRVAVHLRARLKKKKKSAPPGRAASPLRVQ